MMSSADNEAFYDSEISPRLQEIANLCAARGMPFAAAVEYAPGSYGSTTQVDTDQACVAMVMIRCAILANGNLDAMTLGILKWLNAKNINTGASLVANQLLRAGLRGEHDDKRA